MSSINCLDKSQNFKQPLAVSFSDNLMKKVSEEPKNDFVIPYHHHNVERMSIDEYMEIRRVHHKLLKKNVSPADVQEVTDKMLEAAYSSKTTFCGV